MKHLPAFSFAVLVAVPLLIHGFAVNGAEPPVDTKKVVAGNTSLAADLYARLKGQTGNLFFSPYSVSTALAMTSAGARGATAEQMARALHFEVTEEQLPPAFAALETGLNAVQRKGKVQLSVANSLWPDKDYALRPEFVERLKKYYGTTVTPLDFAGATEAARRTINDWVETKTNHKITDLLKPGILGRLTRLVLANAIYFKGKWAAQFDPKATSDQPFYVAVDKEVKAPLMTHTGKFRYAELSALQVLELPYAGDDLSMIVFLPQEKDGISAVEGKLTAANLSDWTKALRSEEVAAYLPRFKATCEFRLDRTLAALGMTDAFDAGKADFTGMGGRKGDLFIFAVVHKAFVEVNEEGTEAAAATGVVVDLRSLPLRPKPVFRADHPFVFLIRDNQTGSVLFLGRVTDPTR